MYPEVAWRSANQILFSEQMFDSRGFVYRGMSLLDLSHRRDAAAPFLHACIELRMGIESLLAELLVVSGQANHDLIDKIRRRKFDTKKTLERHVPHFGKLQDFQNIVAEAANWEFRFAVWDLNKLVRFWGELSEFLHWRSGYGDTWENPEWLDTSRQHILKHALPIWRNCVEHQIGMMPPEDMNPAVKEIWLKFRDSELNNVGAKDALLSLNLNGALEKVQKR